jgi:hypothetical protein
MINQRALELAAIVFRLPTATRPTRTTSRTKSLHRRFWRASPDVAKRSLPRSRRKLWRTRSRSMTGSHGVAAKKSRRRVEVGDGSLYWAVIRKPGASVAGYG